MTDDAADIMQLAIAAADIFDIIGNLYCLDIRFD